MDCGSSREAYACCTTLCVHEPSWLKSVGSAANLNCVSSKVCWEFQTCVEDVCTPLRLVACVEKSMHDQTRTAGMKGDVRRDGSSKQTSTACMHCSTCSSHRRMNSSIIRMLINTCTSMIRRPRLGCGTVSWTTSSATMTSQQQQKQRSHRQASASAAAAAAASFLPPIPMILLWAFLSDGFVALGHPAHHHLSCFRRIFRPRLPVAARHLDATWL